MTKIITIANPQNAVGKTTTAVHLATTLASQNFKTLLVDIDSQCNCSNYLGIEDEEINYTVYNCFVDKSVKVNDAFLETRCKNLYLLPSSPDLISLEIELIDKENKEFFLQQILNDIKSDFDFIIIDCSPSLGLLTLNALMTSNSVLIPISFFSDNNSTTVERLIRTIDFVKSKFNPQLKIEGMLINYFDRDNKISNDINLIMKNYKDMVFKTTISHCYDVALNEFGKVDFMTFQIADKYLKKDFKKLAQEILRK